MDLEGELFGVSPAFTEALGHSFYFFSESLLVRPSVQQYQEITFLRCPGTDDHWSYGVWVYLLAEFPQDFSIRLPLADPDQHRGYQLLFQGGLFRGLFQTHLFGANFRPKDFDLFTGTASLEGGFSGLLSSCEGRLLLEASFEARTTFRTACAWILLRVFLLSCLSSGERCNCGKRDIAFYVAFCSPGSDSSKRNGWKTKIWIHFVWARRIL